MTVTTDEVQLIVDLLKLYYAAWEVGTHKRTCNCVFCEAMEKAGEHPSAMFLSLSLRCDIELHLRKARSASAS